MATKEHDVVLQLGLSRAVRMPWADLSVSRETKDQGGKGTGKLRYGATFLLPLDHEDLKAHKQAIAKLLKDKYADGVTFENGKAYIEEKGDKIRLVLPFHDGDEMAMNAMAREKDHGFCSGHIVLKTSSQYPVNCFDARQRDSKGVPVFVGIGVDGALEGDPILTPQAEAVKEVFYGGCFVAAEVKYRTYKVGTNAPGVTAYLQKVCFVHDGDRIASGARGDTFSAIQGAVTNEDPTGGASEADDEITF